MRAKRLQILLNCAKTIFAGSCFTLNLFRIMIIHVLVEVGVSHDEVMYSDIYFK